MVVSKLISLTITMNLKLHKTEKPSAPDEKPRKGYYIKGCVSESKLTHKYRDRIENKQSLLAPGEESV